jgi:hypothetical protein
VLCSPHSPLDYVTEVSIRCGDLVDSMSLRLSSGRVVRMGGGGGGQPISYAIPFGWRLVGFYGGRYRKSPLPPIYVPVCLYL